MAGCIGQGRTGLSGPGDSRSASEQSDLVPHPDTSVAKAGIERRGRRGTARAIRLAESQRCTTTRGTILAQFHDPDGTLPGWRGAVAARGDLCFTARLNRRMSLGRTCPVCYEMMRPRDLDDVRPAVPDGKRAVGDARDRRRHRVCGWEIIVFITDRVISSMEPGVGTMLGLPTARRACDCTTLATNSADRDETGHLLSRDSCQFRQ
jgi:hypothetical protein